MYHVSMYIVKKNYRVTQRRQIKLYCFLPIRICARQYFQLLQIRRQTTGPSLSWTLTSRVFLSEIALRLIDCAVRSKPIRHIDAVSFVQCSKTSFSVISFSYYFSALVGRKVEVTWDRGPRKNTFTNGGHGHKRLRNPGLALYGAPSSGHARTFVVKFTWLASSGVTDGGQAAPLAR